MNGWDVICAFPGGGIGDDGLCGLFFQEYLEAGPEQPTTPLQFTASYGGSDWIFDGMLGPMLLTFDPATLQPQLQVVVASASLVSIDTSNSTILSLVSAAEGQNVALISGPVTLGPQLDNNNIALSLDCANCQIASPSIPATTSLAVDFIGVLTAYLSATPLSYVVGNLTANSLPQLQPTAFEIGMQASGDGDSAAVLALVTTTGSPGTPPPLDQFPIQAGASATLVISNAVATSGLVSMLNSGFGNGATFTASESIVIEASGGTLDIGPVIVPEPNGETNYVWSVDAAGHTDAIPIPLDGMIFIIQPSELSGNLSTGATFSQSWMYDQGVVQLSSKLSAHVQVSAYLSTTGSDNIINFNSVSANGYLGVTYGEGPLQVVLEQNPVAADISTAIATGFTTAFTNALTPGFDLDSLANFLMPESPEVALVNATFYAGPSYDLVCSSSAILTGTNGIVPIQATVLPGATQTFTLPGAGTVTWSLAAGAIGTIDEGTGVYSAPSDQGGMDVVLGNFGLDRFINRALAIVPSPTNAALLITPTQADVCLGASLTFSVTDGAGNAVQATVSGRPGTVTPGSASGTWVFAAPASVPPGINEVQIQADFDGQSAQLIVSLMSVDTVKMTMSPSAILPGETLELTATSSNSTETDFGWILSGPGTLDVGEDSTTATYTAPSEGTSDAITITAWYADGSYAGLGIANVSLG